MDFFQQIHDIIIINIVVCHMFKFANNIKNVNTVVLCFNKVLHSYNCLVNKSVTVLTVSALDKNK